MPLPINEHFVTIQGEAEFTGTPSLFIRVQGCPVGCHWCDTKHTWEVGPQFKVDTISTKIEDSETYQEMSTADLLKLVGYAKVKHIVFTGGEPALYDLKEISSTLIDLGYSVQLETSGTHEIEIDPRAWVTVSPKFNMKGGFEVLKSCLERANEIKMPIGKKSDLDKVMPLTVFGKRIWLQPLSQSNSATKLCIEAAIEHNFGLSVQTHKYLDIR